jgi:hypothetical protein
MRITKEQLKQIIKEEFEAVMQEQEENGLIFSDMGPEALEAAEKMIEDAAEREEDYEFGMLGDEMELEVSNAQLAAKILAALGEQEDEGNPNTQFKFRKFGVQKGAGPTRYN